MSVDLGAVGGEPVPGAGSWEALGPARVRAGLTIGELFFRYVALGGSASRSELAGHCSTGADLTGAEHDLAVLALNERFLEIEASERLPYLG